MSTGFFETYAATAKDSPSYQAARLSLDFTESLATRMDALRMTRADLARAIGKSPAYVSKILNGDTNFTLETMAALALAVDGEINLRLCGRDDRVMWVAHSKAGNAGQRAVGIGSDDEAYTLAA
ncbi:helix-turn-helix transcriptional regulator [uncultured Rhodospira sp.]|uniref:helix-turn-helix domain-containing protein n=1 Tax=uncultured Rhodospira sp. TaxID=1936189 RepID=UPI002604D08E|nr:helix-turn-helix transcriptional regulator [uncultured Rhodospira sp.]